MKEERNLRNLMLDISWTCKATWKNSSYNTICLNKFFFHSFSLNAALFPFLDFLFVFPKRRIFLLLFVLFFESFFFSLCVPISFNLPCFNNTSNSEVSRTAPSIILFLISDILIFLFTVFFFFNSFFF